MTDFHGFQNATLENEALRLEYLTTAGPRIVGLSLRGSQNLLADVHDLCWETPHGPYLPLGGHRLWTSPESPEKTYLPDEQGLDVRQSTQQVELSWSGFGLRKALRIELPGTGPVVSLRHIITNHSGNPLTLAPWTVTMLRLGGKAILPQPVGNADPHGLLPNRNLVLWPYTSISDPRLALRDEFILLDAQPALPPVKLGYMNRAGWLAYWLDGILFRKSFEVRQDASYPDGGCNAEVYCNDRVIELEALGPLQKLENGESVEFNETWELFEGLNSPFLPETLHDELKSNPS